VNLVSWPNGVTSPDHKVSWMTLIAMWEWAATQDELEATLRRCLWFSVSPTINEEES
jgi:hypothetical protein